MINIFDLSANMAGTLMLRERTHRDGPPAPQGRSDGVNNVADSVENMPVTYNARSSSCKQYSDTSMKKLIEQEMSKGMENSQKPPSVIAKLMGLDALPTQQQSAPITQRSFPECKPSQSYSSFGPSGHHERLGNVCHEKMVTREIRPFCTYAHENREFKDVYEVNRQPLKPDHFKDEPFLRGRCRESPNDKRMALVRQKFMEAKRLATNQKLLQSKEFQDALEVLSSNRDLFLKFLEEPNSLFSKYLREFQASPLPSRTKHITVLKPSKSLDMGTVGKMESCIPVEESSEDIYKPGWGSTFLHRRTESLPQPTRIVVLKPSPSKLRDAKPLVTSPATSPTSTRGEDLFKDTDVAVGSREVATGITRQMQESFSSRRDETMLASVPSNGYIGDESSLYRSDDDMEGECFNFSDSEFATPTSQASWDCVNRVDSPCSLSSSRVSCSSESSVIREAKKRLSERWVMLTSNEISAEQRQSRRSTSTLGEMLTLTELKRDKETNASSTRLRGGSYGGDEDLTAALSCLCSNKSLDENSREMMPGSLQRSKSVPASCSTYGFVRFDHDASSSHAITSTTPTMEKVKKGKSSFKEKVSSFLFSRNKKLSLEKSLASSKTAALEGTKSGDSGCLYHLDRVHGTIPCEALDHDGQRAESSRAKVSVVVEKARKLESASDNLGQPGSVSVLESPFEDNLSSSSLQRCERTNNDCHRAISRSPPIESIARSLSWDGAYAEKTISYPSKHSTTDFLLADMEEHERILFVQTLLSSAGLDDESPSTAFTKWHSLESPLNLTLLDKLMEQEEEAVRFRRSSNQKFLFDCVNAILSEISLDKAIGRCSYSGCCLRFCNGIPSANSVTEEVLKRLNEWFSNVETLAANCAASGNQLDDIVRKEVDRNGWAEMSSLERGDLGKEIEGLMLEELIREALEDFIGCCI